MLLSPQNLTMPNLLSDLLPVTPKQMYHPTSYIVVLVTDQSKLLELQVNITSGQIPSFFLIMIHFVGDVKLPFLVKIHVAKQTYQINTLHQDLALCWTSNKIQANMELHALHTFLTSYKLLMQ